MFRALCDMGGLPNVYTGYQSVADEGMAKKFEEAWKFSIENPD